MKDSVNVDCSYDMTPEQLCAKVSLVDALIIRSGTKASLTFPCQG
jgi:D-3-phosphoglycerate dehydrogenase